MTDLVSLKYFIVLNILFLLFGSSWEGIYLLKHFKNKKNSESWIASKLFYFLLVVINIGLILNVLQLFLLFLTSDFTFSNNYLPEWRLLSRKIFYAITTAISIFIFILFFIITYLYQWKTIIYFNRQTLKSIFSEYDLNDNQVKVSIFNNISLFQFLDKYLICKTNSKFYNKITTFFNCKIQENNDNLQILQMIILRLKYYSPKKISFFLTKKLDFQKFWTWLVFEKNLKITLIVVTTVQILLTFYIFLSGIFQWNIKEWIVYNYNGTNYSLNPNNIIYILSILTIVCFIIEFLLESVICLINWINKNDSAITVNFLKLIMLITSLGLFSYFFSSLNYYVEYLNLKNNNLITNPRLIVERLLFWLQKDYILGMGLFLLFTLFFSSFSLIMDYYTLIRITLGTKIGKEISHEYHFKQLFQKKCTK